VIRRIKVAPLYFQSSPNPNRFKVLQAHEASSDTSIWNERLPASRRAAFQAGTASMMLSVESAWLRILTTFKPTEVRMSRHCCSFLSIADRQASMVQSQFVSLSPVPTSGITISLMKILEYPVRIAGMMFFSMSRALSSGQSCKT